MVCPWEQCLFVGARAASECSEVGLVEATSGCLVARTPCNALLAIKWAVRAAQDFAAQVPVRDYPKPARARDIRPAAREVALGKQCLLVSFFS